MGCGRQTFILGKVSLPTCQLERLGLGGKGFSTAPSRPIRGPPLGVAQGRGLFGAVAQAPPGTPPWGVSYPASGGRGHWAGQRGESPASGGAPQPDPEAQTQRRSLCLDGRGQAAEPGPASERACPRTRGVRWALCGAVGGGPGPAPGGRWSPPRSQTWKGPGWDSWGRRWAPGLPTQV